MGQVSAASSVTIDAQPAAVLAAVADYQNVRPKILSSHFSDYQVVEGGQRLFNRSRRIPAVGLVQVDVVDLEPPKAVFTRPDDPSPRKAFRVAGRVHAPAAFGCEHDRVAHAGLASLHASVAAARDRVAPAGRVFFRGQRRLRRDGPVGVHPGGG